MPHLSFFSALPVLRVCNHDGKVDYIPEPLVVESQHACPRCALLKDIRVAVARDAVASRYLFATSDLAFLCI